MRRFRSTILLMVMAAVFTGYLFFIRGNIGKKQPLPESLPYENFVSPAATADTQPAGAIAEATSTTARIEEEQIVTVQQKPKPNSVNLDVPFQAQAPFANWVEPYKEGCEEASLIMVDYYLRGADLSKSQMQDEIDRHIAWQEVHFGGHFDLPISRVMEMAEALYGYEVEVVADLTVEKIRLLLERGRPVIVPSAGRELGNPNFRIPGPLYHMLVIKGIASDGRFITNDPGTRNGADYVYDPDVLMAAVRDWDGDSPHGLRLGLVMYK